MDERTPQEEHPDEDVIGYEQAASVLGVKLSTLYAWVSRKSVPHYRISGQCVRFSRRALSQWLEASAVLPNTPTNS